MPFTLLLPLYLPLLLPIDAAPAIRLFFIDASKSLQDIHRLLN